MHDYCPECRGDPRRRENRAAHQLHVEATCLDCDKPLAAGRESEYCPDCEQRAAEAAWERAQEGEPPISLDEQHRMVWEEKQRLKR